MPLTAARPVARRARRRALAAVATMAVAALTAVAAPAAAAAPTVVTVPVTETTPRPDGSVPFSTTGTWQRSAVTGPDGAPSLYSTTAGATATWTLPVTEAGTYRVEAGVPDAGNSESAAVYTLSGGSGAPTTATVDQNAERGAWTSLGSVELSAGETATVRLSRQATTTAINTRAASMRLVPHETGTPGSSGLPFSETWSGGTGGWTPLAGALSSWSVEGGEVDAVTIDNLTATSGSYLRPTVEIDLPDAYTLRTSVRAEQLAANGTVSLLVDAAAPYSHIARNTAIQFTATGIKLARPNGGTVLCTGRAPVELGEWANVEVTRANGILAVRVDSALVAAVPAGEAGGTIGVGAYRADARIGGIGVEQLDAAPAGHPTTASGCGWTPSTGTGAPQPVVINQSGYDLGGPKRFTAPNALDGEAFHIVDASDVVVYEGTVQGKVGDFSDFDPAASGPYRILVHGLAGEGDSYEFGIGANWTERVSYDHALAFMSDVRCFFGDLTGKPLNGTHPHCIRGLGWRDSHQMSFELSSLVDLYMANPTPIAAIRMPDAVYQGLEYPTAEGSPEIARLLAWGAEIYLRGQYDHALVKEQLASFLWAYPEFSQWIPRSLYEDVRDYLFPIWPKAEYSRYFWHDYTPHTADLLQVYTQIGTGKGEFPPGHSIVPNLRMWEVAVREGRDDAESYREAAVAQAQWVIDNVDLADPGTTKGQRQGEYHLMTSLATLAATLPGEAEGIAGFAQEWASVAIGRSANMWDFRRYSDDRWTIPSFTGGGSGEDPNESGNVLGFPAAALAATTIIDDPAIDARLTEIAQAHVDNVFGRNPTGRAAQYRINDPELAFEGLDLGWFSEYQGGYGLLQGARGVFDGSPKNGHYPFNPGVANIGHTEGWVTFTTAWIESLAWRAFTSSSIAFDRAEAPADGSAIVTLRAPLNMDTAGGNTGEVRVTVDGTPAAPVTVTQTGINALDYTAELDLAALDARPGDLVTVSHGMGSFVRTASLVVAAPADVTPPVIAGLPADSTLLKDSDSLRLAISASDAESGVERLDVAFDGEPVAPDAELDLAGKAGSHTVSVRAVNGADAAAEASVTVFVYSDTDPASAPARGSLSNTSGHAYGLHDGSYDVVMNLWWGTPGAAFRLYENGELIATEVLAPTGGMSQTTGASFSGRPNGTYVYTAELVNARGVTATTSTTVKVVHAAPAAPVVSHDDWDRDGVFTATANLWWGNNATSYRFELDGAIVGSGELAANTPEAQRASVALSGVAAGTHTLVAVFANADGETASKPVTVTVR